MDEKRWYAFSVKGSITMQKQSRIVILFLGTLLFLASIAYVIVPMFIEVKHLVELPLYAVGLGILFSVIMIISPQFILNIATGIMNKFK